jgi:class 3 adenylate cyclase
VELKIQYARRSDGAKTAYGTMGSGPVLIVPPPWVSHLEFWQAEPVKAFAERLAASHTLVLYDRHGCGLSDRNRTEFTIEDDLKDLRAVVSALALDQFSLFGYSAGGPVALLHALQAPGQVKRLALFDTGAGRSAPSAEQKALGDALVALVRAHWGLGSKALTDLFFGSESNAETLAQFDLAQRMACTAEMAADLLSREPFDLRPDLHTLGLPVLILHRRDDQVAPFENGREMAMLIPHARLVPLEGSNHVPTHGDTESILRPLIDFLDEDKPRTAPVDQAAQGAPVTILFTDIEGSTSMTQRLGDAAAQELLRAHNDIVRGALRDNGGSEIKHTGDGIMAAFPSASRAIESAISIQRAFADPSGDGASVRVRIGLNVGEPVVEGGDLFGTAVQLARRVCDHAQPGQIVIPEGVRHLVAGKGFLFADQGVTSLKGFEDPVRLYEVRWQEES